MTDVTKEQLDALKVRVYDATEANEQLGLTNQAMTKALTDIVKAIDLTGEQITYDAIVAGVNGIVAKVVDLQSQIDALKVVTTAADPVASDSAVVEPAAEAVTTGETQVAQ